MNIILTNPSEPQNRKTCSSPLPHVDLSHFHARCAVPCVLQTPPSLSPLKVLAIMDVVITVFSLVVIESVTRPTFSSPPPPREPCCLRWWFSWLRCWPWSRLRNSWFLVACSSSRGGGAAGGGGEVPAGQEQDQPKWSRTMREMGRDQANLPCSSHQPQF